MLDKDSIIWKSIINAFPIYFLPNQSLDSSLFALAAQSFCPSPHLALPFFSLSLSLSLSTSFRLCLSYFPMLTLSFFQSFSRYLCFPLFRWQIMVNIPRISFHQYLWPNWMAMKMVSKSINDDQKWEI